MALKSSNHNDLVQNQADIRNTVDRERIRRQHREKKKNDDLEAALSELSEFSYSPVDYTPSLVRKVFTPPAIPDYSYLLAEARLKAINRYYTPIIAELALGLLCVIAGFALRDNIIITIICAVGLLACAFFLHKDLHNRQMSINRALTAAKAKINLLIKEARDSIEHNRRLFDEAEDERINKIGKLLNGDPATVFEKIEDALSQIRLPYYVRCSVDFYSDPLITLNLPDQNIIPAKLISLSPAGIIEYEDKTPLQINKQYCEAIAATAIKIATTLYSHIPTLNDIHLQGQFDKWTDEVFYFSLKTTRETLLASLSAHNGLEAFQMLGAEYNIRTSGAFSPIQPIYPEWWEKAPREKVKNFKYAIKELF